MVVRFYGMTLLSAKMTKISWQTKLHMNEDLGNLRTNFIIWCNGGISPKFRERDKAGIINSERKYDLESF